VALELPERAKAEGVSVRRGIAASMKIEREAHIVCSVRKLPPPMAEIGAHVEPTGRWPETRFGYVE